MNKYYSMFIQEFSAVLLADGYSYSGKIFYTTPNFPSLFMFTGKEILNTSIDDLLPDVVQVFHRNLIEDALKFSNLIYIFKTQRNVLLKGKNGLIFNIYLYVKPVPNLSYGLIYFIYVQKLEEPNFIIILDENYHINGFTEVGQVGSNFTMNNNYGLTQLINGYHIGMIIPEFLLQMNYDPKTDSFFILKDNIDIKGYLYTIHNMKELENKLNKILEIIKEKKLSEINNENKFISFEEYDNFIKELNSKNSKPYSIFFRIESHSFINGKYKYFRVYITNDILAENEVADNMISKLDSISEEVNNLKETVFYNSKIRNINEDSSLYDSPNKHASKAKKNKSSNNLINLRAKLNRKSKILIKKELDEVNKDFNNNKEINLNEEDLNKQNLKNIKSNKNKNQINFSLHDSQDSIFQQSNMESAEFNKLKNEIINKNDSFYVKLMKFLTFFFIILAIALIIFDFVANVRVVNNTIEFLQENLYFIHTKIGTACVYNAALNLQLIKKNIIPINYCPNGNCTSFYSNLLIKCYTEVRVQKYNLSSFFQDYQEIFRERSQTELYIFNNTYTDHLSLDIDMFLNLLIGHGFKIIGNLTNYFNSASEEYRINILDVYFKNILSESLKFFYSDYDGFYGIEKKNRLDKVSSNSPIRIIFSLSLVFISSIIIFYLVCKKSRMEIYFLDKLINFTSSNFEEYLKKLEELKKKFRDDTADEEDKNLDELDVGVDDIEGKNENSKDNNDMNYKRQFENKENEPKKKKNKQNKLQQQRLKKKKIMSDYFIKYNIYFGLKNVILFLLSSSCFLVTSLILYSTKSNYMEFDSTIEEVNRVFFLSFQTFMSFKEQIDLYNKENNTQILQIPSESEINSPKIGNALMYIIRNSKYSKEYVDIIETLYNVDACKIISNDTNNNTNEYNFCEKIFSGILTKGLEQAIVQMNLIITNCIDEFESLKKNNKSLETLYYKNTSYANYEFFIGYYMLESFLITQKAFEIFRSDERLVIFRIINIILAIYVIFYLILIVCIICMINSYKKIENSFLNFIGILPAKFIADDESFYNAIFKYGQYFY